MHVFNNAIARMGLDQTEAAERAGVGQADISRIFHGQGSRFSVERLMAIVGPLGIDIEIQQTQDETGAIVHRIMELADAIWERMGRLYRFAWLATSATALTTAAGRSRWMKCPDCGMMKWTPTDDRRARRS